MLFYEPLFLFGFFPAVFTVYLLLRNAAKGAVAWLALASILFYLWAEPKFFALALASAGLDYWLGRQLARANPPAWCLWTGVSSNLALLAVFKYAGFLVGDVLNPVVTALDGTALPVPQVLLPVGISFLVFEKITYLVDLHRKVSRPADSFLNYLLFVFFFPKLLAGPIIKYHEIESQIRHRQRFDTALVVAGFERFAVGVCKKVLIADPASLVSDQIFSAPMAQLGAADAWVGALMFTVQIYFDFSAYSDMAIGIALMLGFRLRENFNFPYASVGITDFWRRWHISLSTWIREYLYIPLGGSRRSAARTYVNLFAAFMASGIWHGANWTYVAWGAFHGLFLVLERAFLGRWLQRTPTMLGVTLTFVVVLHGWVLFRSPNLGHAAGFWARMYDPGQWAPSVYVPVSNWVVCGVALFASMASRAWAAGRAAAWAQAPWGRLTLRALLSALFLYSLGKVLTQPFQPFLYFRF